MKQAPFSYAILRLVPDLEKGERINVGVVVFCRPKDFLGVRTALAGERVAALAPTLELSAVRSALEAIERIAAGDPTAGPVAQLDTTARFHWLVAPASTTIQPSEVHTGMCGDPRACLDDLFVRLVT